MEQDDGFGLRVLGLPQVEGVPVGSEAADDRGARRSVEGTALVADGDFAVVADPDAGLLAPDIGPPWALGGGADDGAIFGERLLLGGVRRPAQFGWISWGDEAKARELYEAVVPTDNWFAALSLARLGRKVTSHPEPLALDAVQMTGLEADPALTSARELLFTGQSNFAPAEWRHALDKQTPTAIVQAIGLASRWGSHDQAIATAAQQKIFNDYAVLYPCPYDREVQAARELSGLPDELIYAIMRQESLFRPDARSTAGALGLMQMLPTTPVRTARKYDRRTPTRTDLLIPEINITLGAGELRSELPRDRAPIGGA